MDDSREHSEVLNSIIGTHAKGNSSSSTEEITRYYPYQELREKVLNIISIPENYQLVVEDNIEDNNHRLFIWEDPQHPDTNIEITLDIQTGELVRLSTDKQQDNAPTACPILPVEQAKRIADEFLKKHLPDLLGEYTWVHSQKIRQYTDISYRQETGSLPLPFSGCECTVDNNGNITNFNHYGRKIKPAWPASIVDMKTVKQQVLKDLRMKLCIACLYPATHEVKEPEYRLVYEPVPSIRFFDAITGRDLFEPDHYVMPSSHPVSPSQQVPEQEDENIEKLIGIDPHLYVLVREKEDKEIIRYVWKKKEHAQQPSAIMPEDRSFDSYLHKKLPNCWLIGNSTIATIEKSTGRLIQLLKDNTCEETPSLNRDECLEKTLHFLQRVFPEYSRYLQLQFSKEPEDGEQPDREFFSFDVYIHNIPVYLEIVRVSVHSATGEIGIYSGVSWEMISMLDKRNFHPRITEQEAQKIYAEQLDIELAWFENGNKNSSNYQLIYRPTTSTDQTPCPPEFGQRREVQYVDACNGKLIWSKL